VPWGRIVGVISDTHGLLRPAALTALAGSQLIVHAGDVGSPEVLDQLRGIAPVIAGHSHRPGVEERDGVLFLNPGSAGPRRFTLPITLARLSVRGGDLDAAIVYLEEGARSR